jgi:hypothetical protein
MTTIVLTLNGWQQVVFFLCLSGLVYGGFLMGIGHQEEKNTLIRKKEIERQNAALDPADWWKS